MEEFLEPRWALVRDSAVSRADRFRYWVENLGLRALQSGVGSSLRQAERRIKHWAGMPMRDPAHAVRAEDAFFRVQRWPMRTVRWIWRGWLRTVVTPIKRTCVARCGASRASVR